VYKHATVLHAPSLAATNSKQSLWRLQRRCMTRTDNRTTRSMAICLQSARKQRFRRDVHETRALLGCYAAYSGNSIPTFRENLWVLSPRVRKSKKNVHAVFNCGMADE